jgi:M6 family metalloprotease-like protein
MRAGIGAAVIACALACVWTATAVAAPAAPAKCVVTKKHKCPATKPKSKPKPKGSGGSTGTTTTTTAPPPGCGLLTEPYLVGEGLPTKGYSLPATGTVRVLLLFVDFPDDPGGVTTQSIADTFTSNVTQFYAENSYGMLNVQLTATQNWVRMPKPSSAYPDPTRGGLVADSLSYLRDAVAAADASVDFSKYDATLVVPPANSAITRAEANLNPSASAPTADGARISYYAPLSSQIEQYPGHAWSLVVHELGHLLSLPDLYDTSPAAYATVAEQVWVGSWDPMSDDWDGHDFSFWTRYKLGWIAQSEFGCLTATGTIESTVSPIESPGGTKALVVDLGAGGDLVAEVRAATGFDRYLCHTGVLISTIDQFGVSGRGPMVVQQAASSPTDNASLQSCGFLSNALYGAGQTYTDAAHGITIQVESANADGSYTIRATLP